MLIIGLMSGTSADGIDAALCKITGKPPVLKANLEAGITVPYPPEYQQRILVLCQKGRVDEVCRLNANLGERFADAVLKLLAETPHQPEDVDLIGSHGQTVWHEVDHTGQAIATLQIGEPAVIAERTGITTISDFRPRDIAAGGQGAPLTGYADWLLLRHPDHWRAIQNIGGMGNVTFLPPITDIESEPLAFDTGPGNALIDAAVHALTDGKQAFDHNGQLGTQGTVDQEWLARLMTHPYYAQRPPKTTGRERFGDEMARQLLIDGQNRHLEPADIIATLTALTAHSIADAYRRFAPQPVDETILGGGGRHNPLLVKMLRNLLGNVRTHEDIGLDSDYKEALVFALLAYETWHNRPSTSTALTGARHPSVLGHITPGSNFERLRATR